MGKQARQLRQLILAAMLQKIQIFVV